MEEKKRNGSYGQTVLYKVVTVIGVGGRRMGLREMRKHNVQSAACVICSKTNFISGAL